MYLFVYIYIFLLTQTVSQDVAQTLTRIKHNEGRELHTTPSSHPLPPLAMTFVSCGLVSQAWRANDRGCCRSTKCD